MKEKLPTCYMIDQFPYLHFRLYFGIKIGGIHFILHAGHTAPPTKQRNLQDGITASDAEVCLP